MPKRQAHSKSRRGCRQCKTGHIKCDEVRPTCTHCIRRGQDCDYSAFRHLRSLNLQNAPPKKKTIRERTTSPASYARAKSEQNLCREAAIYHAFESNTMRPRSPYMRPADHVLELRLIHGLISKSSSIHSALPDGHFVRLCVGNVLGLAKEHSYIMDILMGSNANWLRCQNPNDQSLIAASYAYSLRAIQEYSRQIRHGISESNAEALFLTSLLLPMHSYTSHLCDVLQGDSCNKTGELWLVQWLGQYQGVRAIKEAGWVWLQRSKSVNPILSALPALDMIDSPGREPLFNCLLEGLDEEGVTTVTYAAYRMPVVYLSFVINDGPLRSGLLGFPTSVSERFLELLKGRDPRAMTIVGLFLALICAFRTSGFLTNLAERELSYIIEQLPGEWLFRMRLAQDIMIRSKDAEKDL